MSTDEMIFSISPGKKIVEESGFSQNTKDGSWLVKISWWSKSAAAKRLTGGSSVLLELQIREICAAPGFEALAALGG